MIEPFEPWISKNLVGVLVSLIGLLLEKLYNKLSELWSGRSVLHSREHDRSTLDLTDHGIALLAVERSGAHKHLVEDATNGPPVSTLVVAPIEHFRGHVLCRASHLVHINTLVKHLCKAKVNDPQIAIVINHQVMGLNVAMHYVTAVDVLHSLDNLSCIVP